MAIAAANSSPTMSLSHSQSQEDATTASTTNKPVDVDDNDDHEHDMVMPGFRFHPTEEELVEFYLRRKVEGKRFNVELITFLDLYRYDPWELPGIYTHTYIKASLFLKQFWELTPPFFCHLSLILYTYILYLFPT